MRRKKLFTLLFFLFVVDIVSVAMIWLWPGRAKAFVDWYVAPFLSLWLPGWFIDGFISVFILCAFVYAIIFIALLSYVLLLNAFRRLTEESVREG